MPPASRSHERRWLVRLAWLLAIWAASVAALGIVAYGLRLVMNAVGMTAG